MRSTYQAMYSEARICARKYPKLSANSCADMAARYLIDGEGYTWKECERVFRAVLWAIHWRFYQEDDHRLTRRPYGMSVRHMGFSLGPEVTRVWYYRKLPDGIGVTIHR